jgi:CRISPR-associated protein Cas2
VRGALTQWYLEVLPGIFVGRPTARVRDRLWKALCDGLALENAGYAALIQQASTEQGFTILTTGAHPYRVEDFDGLLLVSRQPRESSTDPLEGLPPDPTW